MDQFVIDTEIEVVHIAAPIARGRDDTVSPTGIYVILLLIVQEIGVEFPHNVVFVAEHEKSSRGRMLLPIGADAHGTQSQKEIFILQRFPHVAGAREAHSLAIAADTFLVEHGHIHLVQNEHILCFHGGIPHHGLVFFFGAAIVTLTISAVGAERISIHIHRLIGAFCTGDIDDHDMIAIVLLNKHILGGQNIYAGLIGVIDDVPELFDEFLRVGQIHRAEGLIGQLLHAQQDNTAVSVSKGRIGFPNALGQAAEGFLGLNAVILPILLYLGKINHAAPPSPVR